MSFQKHIEKIDFDVIDEITMGDKVVLEVKAMVKLKMKEHPIELTGVVSCCVENGRIVTGRNYFDALPIFEELGFLPHDTFNLCLSGARLDVML